MTNDFWLKLLESIHSSGHAYERPATRGKILVEFASPNTNKPIHLGHIRNILLGWSCAKIYDAAGYEVVKTQIVNDRGIAICKSMLAWQKYGNGQEPEDKGVKGDHFVGDFYVLFEKKFKEEYRNWQKSEEAQNLLIKEGVAPDESEGFFKKYKNSYFNRHSDLGREAKQLLLAWEDGEKDSVALWKKMNSWVYAGFDETYRALNIEFDQSYYESNTYLLGRKFVLEGLEKGLFYKKEDGSIWVDLEDSGLDQKILLRSDGTSVYLTQDLGTAELRYHDHETDKMVYVVADEQDYHFKVLFETLKKLERPYANGLYHLSYGMVDLPTGKMKSREGTVVDADDLMKEVFLEAKKAVEERGELAGLSDTERDKITNQIAMAALKFFIIKVHPKKRMIFDPKESVDMQGQTGPYIQNAYVRIQSIFRKNAGSKQETDSTEPYILSAIERHMLRDLADFPNYIENAAREYDPSSIANFAYQTAKAFHKFYHDFRILNAESESARTCRLKLAGVTAQVLKDSFDLLGIEMPERM